MRGTMAAIAVLAALLLLIPMAPVDAAHIGGDGHGDGIDAVYSSTEYSVLRISLASKPIDRIDVVLVSAHDKAQKVENIEPNKSVAVELRTLKQGIYDLQVQLHHTSQLLAQCELVVGYTVTVSFLRGEGSGSMNPAEVVSGTQYALPEAAFEAPEGKRFAAWAANGVRFSPGTAVTVDGDMAFTALYSAGSDPDVGPDDDSDDEGGTSSGTDISPLIAVAGAAVIGLLLVIAFIMRSGRSD